MPTKLFSASSDTAALVSGRLRWRGLTPAEWRDADDRRLAELEFQDDEGGQY